MIVHEAVGHVEQIAARKRGRVKRESGIAVDVDVDRVYRDIAVAAAELAHVTGQIVLPAPEQIPGELSELPKLAVGGTLRGFQLLRLNEKALLLEGLLEFFALQGFPGLPFASAIVLMAGRVPLARRRCLNPLAGSVEKSPSRGGGTGLTRRLLEGLSREELVTAHALVTGATVVAKITAGIHGETLLLLQAGFGAAGELELAYAHLRRRIIIVLGRHGRYEYGGAFPFRRLTMLLSAERRVPLRPGR